MFSAFSKVPPWVHVMEGEGGGGQQDSCLVAKQAVGFPQVLVIVIKYKGI